SVTYKRTEGVLSAKCHDEEANRLALNLTHDIITGRKSAEEAKQFYLQCMIDSRAGKATPYMEKLQFEPCSKDDAQDADKELMSEEELKKTAENEKSKKVA